MLNLKDLGEPSEFWDYFEKISKIPRCSEHEEKIRSFIKEEAESLGFKYKIDSVGNLVVIVPAKVKQKSTVVLQCHMDMVCEKNESVSHDFSRDPLKLKIEEIENDKWLTADGTTLGADDGVGICYILTLMKKICKRELNFNLLDLNLLFTVDEEQGLRGAFKVEKEFLDGDFLINLDSEEDNAVTIGCAGGLVHIIEIKKNVIELNLPEQKLTAIRVFISGLRGGHSGGDIHLGRGNALKIMGQLLWKLNKQYSIYVCSIDGGNRPNAIPREVESVLYVEQDQSSEIISSIETLFTEIKVIFDEIEPNLTLSLERLDSHSNNKVLNKNIQDNLLNIMYLIPNGPLSMHPRIEGLVFSSSNFSTITTREDDIELKVSQRSLSEYFKNVIWEKTKILLDLSGLEIKIIKDSDYPGWTPNFQSHLLKKYNETYKKLFNEEFEIIAIHAGLECGILKKTFPKMEMISIGPTNEGAHSPDERLLIKSVAKVWDLLINLLRKLN